jgi:acyl-CoA thioesterase-2
MRALSQRTFRKAKLVRTANDHSLLEGLLTLTEAGPDSYQGEPRPGTILPKTFGGQTFAQALAAACRTVDPSRPPVSAQGLFLSAGNTDGPARFDVERVRDGRSMEMDGFAHAAPMPEVAGPDRVPPLVDVMERRSTLPAEGWREEWSFLDLRYVEENLVDPSPLEGRQQLWLRLPEVGGDAADAGAGAGAGAGAAVSGAGGTAPEAAVTEPWRLRCALAYVSDLALLAASLVPHGHMLGAPDIPRATLTHAIHFHADPEPGGWILIDQRSRWAGGGRGLSESTLYAENGRPLASCLQDGLIRQRRPRAARG